MWMESASPSAHTRAVWARGRWSDAWRKLLNEGLLLASIHPPPLRLAQAVEAQSALRRFVYRSG
jgi:hypothetical protein